MRATADPPPPPLPRYVFLKEAQEGDATLSIDTGVAASAASTMANAMRGSMVSIAGQGGAEQQSRDGAPIPPSFVCTRPQIVASTETCFEVSDKPAAAFGALCHGRNPNSATSLLFTLH